jgi:hypothetical protein
MQRFIALPTVVLSALAAMLTVALATGSARGQTSGSLVQWGSTAEGRANNAPPAGERFIAIAAGYAHCLALRANGSLVQWGATSAGQTANAPAASERFIAIAAGYNHNLALRADGSLVQWGSASLGQANGAPPAAGPYVAVAAGLYHSLGLRADGSLVQWGRTSEGQANSAPPNVGPYIAIAAGDYYNLALKADGSLVKWGRTSEGQENNAPLPAGPYIAIAAGISHNLALRADGSLVQWGATSSGQANNAPPTAGPYIAITAGGDQSLALRADGSLVQWGATSSGEANDAPPASERFIAIAAGGVHSLALKSALPATASFTYQGRLAGQSGPVDLQCVLYDASTAGNQVGGTTTVNNLDVDAQGLFTALVTPGAIDASGSLWLEVRVAPAGSGSFTALTPRQAVTRAPQASFADVAATAQLAVNAQTVWWSGIKGVPGNVSGAFSPWQRNSRGIDYRDSESFGNVGIGVAAPLTRLHVTAGGGDALYVQTANESPWALRIGNDIATAAGFQTGMYVTNSGFFRITNRIANPNGTYAQLGTNGAWTALSDARLKTDVTDAEGNLAAALRLRPVNFRWKSDGAEDFGLIAQEVRAVLPRLVTGDESKDSLTLNYSQLSVVAIGAIQEQQREIDRMKAEAARNAAENADLKARLERLEKALETKPAGK